MPLNCSSLADLQNQARNLAACLHSPVVIALNGELGTGKTSFAQGLIAGLGFEGLVKSPTFTLVESYPTSPIETFHFDWYRLEHPRELENIGIWEYLESDAICLIEWAEKAPAYCQVIDLQLNFSEINPGRRIEATALTGKGEKILKAWKTL